LPPVALTEISVETRTVTQTQGPDTNTNIVRSNIRYSRAASTRYAASPTPSPYTTSYTSTLPKTTSVEVLVEHEEQVIREEPLPDEEEEEYEEIVPRRALRRSPLPPSFPPARAPPPPPPAAYRQQPQQRWLGGSDW